MISSAPLLLLPLLALTSASWEVREHGSGSYDDSPMSDCLVRVAVACSIPDEEPTVWGPFCTQWRECAPEREALGCADDPFVVLFEQMNVLPNCASVTPSPPPTESDDDSSGIARVVIIATSVLGGSILLLGLVYVVINYAVAPA